MLPKNSIVSQYYPLCFIYFFIHTLEQKYIFDTEIGRANAYPLPVDSRFYKRAAKAFARIGSLENLSQVARDVGTGTGRIR